MWADLLDREVVAVSFVDVLGVTDEADLHVLVRGTLQNNRARNTSADGRFLQYTTDGAYFNSKTGIAGRRYGTADASKV